jgi:hypothetical protein
MVSSDFLASIEAIRLSSVTSEKVTEVGNAVGIDFMSLLRAKTRRPPAPRKVTYFPPEIVTPEAHENEPDGIVTVSPL